MNDEHYTLERVNRMARRLLYRDVTNIPEKTTRRYDRVLCACGEKAAWPAIVRNKKRVCAVCAKQERQKPRAPRKHSIQCDVCGEVVGRAACVMRQGNLICKSCLK